MVHHCKGDLLAANNLDVICHQVNCQGAMNSGIAKSIRDKWPDVYKKYKLACGLKAQHPEKLLGTVLAVLPENDERNPIVENMFCQLNYGYDGGRYTSYDAFWMALHYIKEGTDKNMKIGFPKNIGCCRGGANWNIILAMIEEVLGDREVYIYELDLS